MKPNSFIFILQYLDFTITPLSTQVTVISDLTSSNEFYIPTFDPINLVVYS